MCYSGKCYFENYMGDCRVHNYTAFRESIGMTACYVGCGQIDKGTQEKAIEKAKELNLFYQI